MLSLLPKGPQMDPYRLLESPKSLKNMIMSPLMALKCSNFSHRSFNGQNPRKRRALGRAEIHH